jgi:hypothetical protein
MQQFYLQKTGNTYLQGVHVIPDGAVPISDDLYQEIIANPAPGKIRSHDAEGLPILIDPPAVVITAADLCLLIDAAADKARSAVVADPVRAMEYQLAAQEAQPFKDAGYPSDAVPRTVAAYAIKGRTPQEAADSILAEAAAYNEALYSLREIRLSAKAEIHELFKIDAPEQAKTLADSIVAHINSLVAGVGNASTEAAEVNAE